jgi:phospholipid/cholesterol/gamma-HCH transport system ATP-binding protein
MAERMPMISVRDLYKSFGDHQVLKGVDLDVDEGTTCVILGGSGSGKTVLMKHIIGLLKPDRGQVFVDGEDVVPLNDLELERIRRKFGMVFQGSALFDSMTVGENVSFPLREHSKLSEAEIRTRVEEKLAIVGLYEVVDKYPAELSGGMRKRVGLARAIVRDPKIVLYDEPTTGLDPITTDYVDEMILTAKVKLGVTSLVISHDVASSFKVADQIAFLSDGKIVAHAPPAQLRNSNHPVVKLFLSTWFGKN